MQPERIFKEKIFANICKSMVKINKKVEKIRTEEERRLTDYSPSWLKEIIIFGLHTGLRQDELLSLQWSRVNLFRKTIMIQGFHFHDLRHTFATRLAQKGIDIYKVSKLLGHQDIRMTQRYSHHCPDSLRDGVQVLEADYNLTTFEENRNVSNT